MTRLRELWLPAVPTSAPLEVLEVVRHRTLRLCRALGVIGGGRMELRTFDAGKFELLTTLVSPGSNLDVLTIVNDFLVYLFVIDDQADEDARFGRDAVRLRTYFEGHVELLRNGGTASGGDPVGLLLLDLRRRLVERTSHAWLERFADSLGDYLLKGVLPAALDWNAGTVLDVEAFIAQRAYDSASFCVQDLIELGPGGELPQEAVRAPELATLRRLCTDVLAHTNDLVSYSKEIQCCENPSNLVHVIKVRERRPLQQAIERVIGIINTGVEDYERIVSQLPASLRQQPSVHHLIHGQRCWMSGNLIWSTACGRYRDPRAPFDELRDSEDTSSGTAA